MSEMLPILISVLAGLAILVITVISMVWRDRSEDRRYYGSHPGAREDAELERLRPPGGTGG